MTQIKQAALVALVALTGCGGDSGDSADTQEPAPTAGGQTDESGTPARGTEAARKVIAQLDDKQIIARVEELRGLRFEKQPTIGTVTAEQSAAEAERKAGDLTAKETRLQEASISLLKLQGVAPPDFEVDDAASTLGGEAFLGYYDPKTTQLNLVAGPNSADPAKIEPIAAHELLHALQDEKFGIDLEGQPVDDPDASSAYRSLVEGDGRVVEDTYAKEYDLKSSSQAAAGAAGQQEQLAQELPFALIYDIASGYELGALFIAALVKKAGSYRSSTARCAHAHPGRWPRSSIPSSTSRGTARRRFAWPSAVRLRMASSAPCPRRGGSTPRSSS